MRSLWLQACLLGFLVTALGQVATADELFPDENLRTVVKEILKKKQIEKENLEPGDVKTIFFLDARGRGIKDLSGLQHCVNLAEVKLSDNEISDVAPLAECKNIQSLYLSKNKLTSVKPVESLVKIQYLEAEENQITSLEGLAPLTNLRALYIAGNQIADLSPLANAKKLTSLDLNNNQVSDLSPIKDLPWISTLGLKNNKVSDLAPISGYTDLHMTFLEGNPLEDLSVLVEMAKKDVEGPKSFAPFWFLFLDVDSLPDAAKQQVEELKKLGVRINQAP
ncbi:MAG: leucine-rich repeat domain-containing protein [Planctomycetaceae bacterium]|nr:leucine-rich repeat domain-containing protein [Planctomycetaceae bacterium]